MINTEKTIQWFRLFLDEKGIDLEDGLNVGEGNIGFTVANVVEYAEQLPLEILVLLQRKIVQLDFQNAPIKPFLEFLGKGIVNNLI